MKIGEVSPATSEEGYIYLIEGAVGRYKEEDLEPYNSNNTNTKATEKMSNILDRANKIVNERSEEKERQYGPFSESMARAADIYNLMSPKDEQITTTGMYRALIALKLSREAYSHKEDNLLDAVAYIGALNNYIEENSISK